MTERDYQHLLDTIQDAIDADTTDPRDRQRGIAPRAANDNGLAWPLIPFPQGWQASS